MNEILNVFRALIEADDVLKTHSSLNTFIEIYMSKEDNERLATDDWQYIDTKNYKDFIETSDVYLKTFEGVPVGIDETLKPNEFKIKVNWGD